MSKVLSDLRKLGLDGQPAWRNTIYLGLPEGFDFSNIRTVGDAFHLIVSLPNSQRGIAAKRLYEHRDIVGRRVAYRGLIEAWQHDHAAVRLAFGSDIAFAAALRDVAPARTSEKRIIAWRGTDHVDAAFGESWTTNRDVACWFAIHSSRKTKTPFVFRCVLDPEDIVIQYNGRKEHELIVDPAQLVFAVVTIDDGTEEGFETYPCDIASHDEIPLAVIEDWRIGAARYGAFISARDAARFRRAQRLHRRRPIT
jgi:hypothetical protein